jgi:hypothetical protein
MTSSWNKAAVALFAGCLVARVSRILLVDFSIEVHLTKQTLCLGIFAYTVVWVWNRLGKGEE